MIDRYCVICGRPARECLAFRPIGQRDGICLWCAVDTAAELARRRSAEMLAEADRLAGAIPRHVPAHALVKDKRA